MTNAEITIGTKLEIAVQLVIMDAIEKGHTDKKDLIAYMSSETFNNAVENYLSLI